MIESQVESYLVKQYKKRVTGLILKFISPSMRGLPDRILLLPGGKVLFVETKRPSEKARANQLFAHRLLSKLGFAVYVSDTKEEVEKIICEIEGDQR